MQANANEQRESTELESRSDLVQGQCGEVYHQAVSTDAQQSAQLYKQAASTDAQQFESEECGARLMQSTEVDPCLALSRIDTE